jgi:peptidyl-dipeptidase Dcp
MTYSDRREMRERMYRAYGSIGGRGNIHDNNRVIRRIVELRSQQARLLGYDTYCDYVLEDRMVQSLPNLRRFMQELKEAVLSAAKKDLAEMTGISGLSGISGWDISYLSEKLKQQRYAFDSESLRPYFPLEAVREGIFGLYGRLYGLRFEPAPEVPVYHEEVKVYRVLDKKREMGILYLDMHPRPSKRSGAWMTEFRGQYGAVRPQIQVVCNFSKPTADSPALLRFSEVETFMHEMGHAMHGMLSEVRYESLSGTNVKRDFVEMPSQVMENWCYEPEFINTFARHYRTGEPLPAEYIDKIRAAQNHLAGWLCLRQLNLGFTDIAFHTMGVEKGEWKAESIEADAMVNLLPRVEGCCTATNFNHIFGDGYASGYYGYKWAEVLDADIFSRFKADGIFNRETASAFRREILSRGGTEHPAVLFKNFMGREPDNKALLKRMNLL